MFTDERRWKHVPIALDIQDIETLRYILERTKEVAAKDQRSHECWDAWESRLARLEALVKADDPVKVMGQMFEDFHGHCRGLNHTELNAYGQLLETELNRTLDVWATSNPDPNTRLDVHFVVDNAEHTVTASNISSNFCDEPYTFAILDHMARLLVQERMTQLGIESKSVGAQWTAYNLDIVYEKDLMHEDIHIYERNVVVDDTREGAAKNSHLCLIRTLEGDDNA